MPSSVDGWTLGLLYVLAIVNNAAVNVGEHLYLYMYLLKSLL